MKNFLTGLIIFAVIGVLGGFFYTYPMLQESNKEAGFLPSHGFVYEADLLLEFHLSEKEKAKERFAESKFSKNDKVIKKTTDSYKKILNKENDSAFEERLNEINKELASGTVSEKEAEEMRQKALSAMHAGEIKTQKELE